jgi:FAD/FMN-containing dehydrogenase
LAVYVVWEDEANDARCRAWLADRMREIEAVSIGQYLGDSDFTARPPKFVANANYERLEQIRAKYDPNGLFHSYLAPAGMLLNQNR